MLNVKKAGIILGLLSCNASLSAVSPEQEVQICAVVDQLLTMKFSSGRNYARDSSQSDFNEFVYNSSQYEYLEQFLKVMEGIDAKALSLRALRKIRKLIDGSLPANGLTSYWGGIEAKDFLGLENGLTFNRVYRMLLVESNGMLHSGPTNPGLIDFFTPMSLYWFDVQSAGDLSKFVEEKLPALINLAKLIYYCKDVQKINSATEKIDNYNEITTYIAHSDSPIYCGCRTYYCNFVNNDSDTKTIDNIIEILWKIHDNIINSCEKFGLNRSSANITAGLKSLTRVINLLGTQNSTSANFARSIARAVPTHLSAVAGGLRDVSLLCLQICRYAFNRTH